MFRPAHGKRVMTTVLAATALLLLISAASLTLAGSGYELNWWTVDGGGGASEGAGYALQGTVGQPDAGVLSGDGYDLNGGFWAPQAPSEPGGEEPPHTVLLPVVVSD